MEMMPGNNQVLSRLCGKQYRKPIRGSIRSYASTVIVHDLNTTVYVLIMMSSEAIPSGYCIHVLGCPALLLSDTTMIRRCLAILPTCGAVLLFVRFRFHDSYISAGRGPPYIVPFLPLSTLFSPSPIHRSAPRFRSLSKHSALQPERSPVPVIP